MSQFRCHVLVSVWVTSEPIEAENPVEAMSLFMRRTNLDNLLRDTVGTRSVSQVAYSGEMLKGKAEGLNDEDDVVGPFCEFSPEELQDL